jgi:HAD superfamily hydrolase (TIGR01493 family)
MIDMTQFDALTFDVYGTLIDWEPTIIAMFKSIAEQYQVELSEEQLLLEFDRARASLQRIRPALLYPERAVFSNSVMLWPGFADAKDSLDYLSKHFKIGLLSNIDNHSLAFSNRKLGLKPDVVATAERVKAYKPDHNHFDAAFADFEALGIPRSRILHVGQSLRADVIPANQLGISSVWIRRPGRSLGSRPEDAKGAKADLEFDSMQELADFHKQQLSSQSRG